MPINSVFDVAGCVTHIDLQNEGSITKDASNVVSHIADLSLSGNHISAITGAPTHGTHFHNGNSIVKFAIADVLEGVLSAAILPSPCTIFVVGGFDSYETNAYLLIGSSAWDFRIGSWTPDRALFRANSINHTTPAPLFAVPHTIVSGTTTADYRMDGVDVITGVARSNTGNRQLRIGNGAEGWLGEIVFYSRQLTPTEIGDVEALLVSNWADVSTPTAFAPPTGHNYIEMATTIVPADSVVFGDTFVVGDQVAYETTATHTNGSTGTVVLDQFGVPTITGTSAVGTWTFDYWIKDANGENTVAYTYSVPSTTV